MKTPRSTKNAERGAAEQGKREFTGTELLALISTAINHAALRFWFATPSRWLRGTIRTKAKAPVLENTFGQAVATPTDKRGFVIPKFWGLVRLHLSQAVYGHGGGYPQGRPHGLSRVFNHHAHPLRVKTQRVALKSRQGAPTMHPTTSASVRVTTPTTGTAHALNFEAVNTTTNEAQAFALLQATSDAAMAKLYLSRGNIPAARRKAVQLLKALQGLSKFECAQASASPCTGCPDNFPLPDGPLVRRPL